MTIAAALWFLAKIFLIPALVCALLGGILGGDVEDAAVGFGVGLYIGLIILVGTFVVFGLVLMTGGTL